MRVTVNGKPVFLAEGMKVRHALLACLPPEELATDPAVTDQWGNLMGLDGELAEGSEITVRIGVKTP